MSCFFIVGTYSRVRGATFALPGAKYLFHVPCLRPEVYIVVLEYLGKGKISVVLAGRGSRWQHAPISKHQTLICWLRNKEADYCNRRCASSLNRWQLAAPLFIPHHPCTLYAGILGSLICHKITS